MVRNIIESIIECKSDKSRGEEEGSAETVGFH